MIVDASALVAIILREPEADRFTGAIAEANSKHIAALNWLELLIAAESRRGAPGREDAENLVQKLELEILALDREQLQAARAAWQRFGKGRHPARLNLGDCCAYAASVTTGEPLLFKGNDFALTDVEVAAW